MTKYITKNGTPLKCPICNNEDFQCDKRIDDIILPCRNCPNNTTMETKPRFKSFHPLKCNECGCIINFADKSGLKQLEK